MVLSEKVKNNLFVIVDGLDMQTAKTKSMATMIKKLPVANASRLVLYTTGKNVFLSARNIAKTGVTEIRNMNVADLLNYKYVVLSKDEIKEIEKMVSIT